MQAERTPVIVGDGEAMDRPADLMAALEPLALMQLAAQRADERCGMVAEADALYAVNLQSWRYTDLLGDVARRLGMAPAHRFYSPVGGEQPTLMIHDAALRIARGETKVAVVVGAEARSSQLKARNAGVQLPWTLYAKEAQKTLRGADMVNPLVASLGATQATNIYPFYDLAASAEWGQTPAEALQESGEIWSRYSKAAMQNPASWAKRSYSPEEIVTPAADNRLIAFPYTKLMVANPMVNQAAAVIVTSLAHAREKGVPEERIVHIRGGASAKEPTDFLARDQYHMSHAQEAVLGAAKALAPGGRFDWLELYSCFPCVPKMARRTLGLGGDVEPSVTGGLTFFGGPLSVYMLHAACAMVRRVRERRGVGLLYGQGEFVTKHHALVLAADAGAAPIAGEYSVQEKADARRGFVPELVDPAPGTAVCESASIYYERDGAVQHGVVILKLEGGRRTMAAVAPGDAATLGAITDMARTVVGRTGEIVAGEGRMEWRVSA